MTHGMGLDIRRAYLRDIDSAHATILLVPDGIARQAVVLSRVLEHTRVLVNTSYDMVY